MPSSTTSRMTAEAALEPRHSSTTRPIVPRVSSRNMDGIPPRRRGVTRSETAARGGTPGDVNLSSVNQHPYRLDVSRSKRCCARPRWPPCRLPPVPTTRAPTDQAAPTMNIRVGAADTTLTVRNGNSILYSQASLVRSCFDLTTGKAATAANTDKVIIKAASGTGAAAQTTTIDASFGGSPERNPNLQFFVFTGTNDR